MSPTSQIAVAVILNDTESYLTDTNSKFSHILAFQYETDVDTNFSTVLS